MLKPIKGTRCPWCGRRLQANMDPEPSHQAKLTNLFMVLDWQTCNECLPTISKMKGTFDARKSEIPPSEGTSS